MSHIKRRYFRMSKDKFYLVHRAKLWYSNSSRKLKIRIRRFHKPKDIIKLIDFIISKYEDWFYRWCYNIPRDDKRFDTYEKIIEFAINKYGLKKYINKMEDNTWKENLIQKHQKIKSQDLEGRVLIEIPAETKGRG